MIPLSLWAKSIFECILQRNLNDLEKFHNFLFWLLNLLVVFVYHCLFVFIRKNIFCRLYIKGGNWCQGLSLFYFLVVVVLCVYVFATWDPHIILAHIFIGYELHKLQPKFMIRLICGDMYIINYTSYCVKIYELQFIIKAYILGNKITLP